MSQTVAKAILEQLGGGRFVMMTGAKNLVSHGNGLSFKVSGTMTTGGINYVKIVLNGMDYYDIEFGKTRGYTYKVVRTVNDADCDNLAEIFRDVTGLETRMPRFVRSAA